MRPTIILALFLTVTASLLAQSQSDIDKALEIGRQGIEAADAGDYDHAIGLYEQAMKLDPSDPTYPYEIAYVYYLRKDYQYVVTHLTELIKHDRATDRFYQLLGNSHDYLKNPRKAIEIYDAGLERFPKSGHLHLERGLMAMLAKDYDAAVNYWEAGIAANPSFPSNYYWAAKLFCNSTDRIWGVLYGEIFMNIEPDTKRTHEISKLVYDAYKASITIRSDSSAGIDFARQILYFDPENEGEIKIPFTMDFGTSMALAAGFMSIDNKVGGRSTDTSLTISTIHSLRSRFLTAWYQNGSSDRHSVALFDWQNEMLEAGHFEFYNYWLFSKGNVEEMKSWMSNNPEKYKAFATWVHEHPLPITSENYFSRPRVLNSHR
jgi:tetratricopeptide (TPR) repeat protein